MALVSDLQLTIGRLLSKGRLYLRAAAGERVEVESDFRHTGSKFALFGGPLGVKPTVTGSTGGVPAVESMVAALASLGVVTNSTSSGGTVISPTPTEPTNASPSISIGSVTGAVVGTAFTLSGSYSDPDGSVSSVVVRRGTTTLGNANLSGGTWSFSVTESTSGDKTYSATATDNAGATSSASRTVSVGSGTTTTTPTPTGTFTATFAGEAVDAIPLGFVRRFHADASFAIGDQASASDGKAAVKSGRSSARQALEWSKPGIIDTNAVSVEVLLKMRSSTPASGVSVFAGGALLCGSGAAGSESGYACGLGWDGLAHELRIIPYVNGVADPSIGRVPIPNYVVGNWYWIRAKRSGNLLRVHVWANVDGVESTTTKIETTTETALKVGWVGLYAFASETQIFDAITVGVGMAAPTPP